MNYTLPRYSQKDKIRILSLALVTALVYPVNAVHESGHALVCYAEGGEYTIKSSFYGFGISCHHMPGSLIVYWLMGGVFGMSASAAPFIASRARKSPTLKIAFLTLTATQFITLLMETLFHRWYITEKGSTFLVLAILSIAIWFLFYYVFYHRPHHKHT